MPTEQQPPHMKIWGGIFKDYYRSFFVLVIVFIQHYIRNVDVTIPHIRAGFALSWVIFGICMYTLRGVVLQAVSLLFITIMAYTFLDNVAMDSKYFDAGDAYLMGSCVLASVAWLLMQYRNGAPRQTRGEINSAVALLVLTALILAGRNYLQHYPGIFRLMNWHFDLFGGPFYKSDAFGHILAALLFIYNTRRLDMLFGGYYLVMACYNYIDEMYYDPTIQSDGEWLASIIIHSAFIFVLLWYLRNRIIPSYRSVS